MSPYYLLLLPVIFYIVPAIVPIWRVFVIIWVLLGGTLGAAWDSIISRGSDADQLNLIFNKAFLLVLVTFLIMSFVVQSIRHFMYQNQCAEYHKHWLIVFLGGVVSMAIGLQFLIK